MRATFQKSGDRWVIAGWTAMAGVATWGALEVAVPEIFMTQLGLRTELAAIALAAGGAGFATARIMVRGPLLACLGAIMATGLGGAIGAAVVVSLEGQVPDAVLPAFVLGPLFLFAAILSDPTVTGIWVLAMLVVRWVAVRPESCDCP